MNVGKDCTGIMFTNVRAYSFGPRPASRISVGNTLGCVGRRVVLVGSQESVEEAIRKVCAEPIRVVDMGGTCVLPAFHDSHFHMWSFSLASSRVNLSACGSLEEAVAEARRFALANPGKEWIRGRGFDIASWRPERIPTQEDLDRAVPDRPVAISSKDGHALWANSLALSKAGIGKVAPEVDGGSVRCDPKTNEPTGLFYENAVDLVEEHLPETDEDPLKVILRGIRACYQLGICCVHDFSERMQLRHYLELEEQGLLHFRVLVGIPETALESAVSLGLRSGYGSDHVRIGWVKVFADGALGSRTADMFQPYDDDPGSRGIEVTSSERLAEIRKMTGAAGLSMAVHAIGDRAVKRTLDVLSEPLSGEGLSSTSLTLPCRIEHAQLVRVEDRSRFGRGRTVASVQPIHATADMEMAERRWGQRCAHAYPWRSLTDAGTSLVFGSDAPIEHPDPLAGLHAAVTRQRRDGTPRGGWYSGECLSARKALLAYTVTSAEIAGLGETAGALRPGQMADFVVLDGDPLEVPTSKIPSLQVLGTVVDGRAVYVNSSGPLAGWDGGCVEAGT